MITHVPDFIGDIAQAFHQGGYEVYLVGGSVRDLLLGKAVKDWDLTTNATPEDMLRLFPDAFYDNQFGTVGIPVASDDQKHVVEATTFRSESGYKDRRHPETITWGKTIDEDLKRRDFTINAMAIELTKELIENREWQIETTHLLDPFGGQDAIHQHLIKAVGNPAERFKEDALRMLRAVRFAAQMDFSIEAATRKAMHEDSMLLPAISGERIRDELLKILASNKAYDGIMMLYELGLLKHIIPELLEGIGVSQERPGRHHTTDVFTHNLWALKECPSSDPIVRFATMIHDIGKPHVKSYDSEGLVIFYNHEVAGARIAYEICERLHFSKKDRKKIITLIRWHMFTIDEDITDQAVRRFIRKIGVENVKDMIDLRIGDRLGSGTKTAESWRLRLFKDRIEQQLAPAPFSIKDLAINGNDIMRQLQIKPGPIIGELLQTLFEEVDEDLSKNTKEYLSKRIRELHDIIPL